MGSEMATDRERKMFSERLNQMLDEEGWPPLHYGRQVQLARLVKVSQNSARKWLLGETIPRQDALVTLATKFGREPHWLRYGSVESSTANVRAIGVREAAEVYVDVVVSTVEQRSRRRMDSARQTVPIAKEYLDRKGLKASRCTVVYAPGNNMAPAIRQGDELLVNRDNRLLEDGRIYVFLSAHGYRVNLVSLNADDSITLVSENRDFPPERIRAEEIDALNVTGVVERIVSDR